MTDVWTDRHVLVTGATGLVGSALCPWLVGAGAHVVALVRDLDPQSDLIRSGTSASISILTGRLEDFRDVERAVNEHDIEVVFHLGAQTIVGTAHRSPLPTLEANVLGTANVLEAARLHSSLVRGVVVASSDKAYGEQPNLPYTENMPLHGRAPYEVSKSCTDLISQSYAITYGMPVAVARCGNIYGPGDLNWSRIVPGTIRSLLRSERPIIRSDGRFLRDYLFLDDVVDAYVVLGERLLQGELRETAFNFSPERAVDVLEIYRATCLATVGQEVEPVVLDRAQGEIRDQYLDATLAKEELAWSARHTLEQGLTKTVPWYRDLLGAT